MSTQKKLDERLLSAVPYVKRGGFVADIGTDHAYLPIELCRRGICRHAIACDINAGPINSAKANIATAGMQDKIDTLLTDGLHGVEKYHPDDIIIFGMGGELIANILTPAEWTKNASIGLILQPMSRAETLRKYLCDNGFSILDETLSHTDRLYQTIYTRYTGKREIYSDSDLLTGREEFLKKSPYAHDFLTARIAVLENIVKGKKAGLDSTDYEENLIFELRKRLEDL